MFAPSCEERFFWAAGVFVTALIGCLVPLIFQVAFKHGSSGNRFLSTCSAFTGGVCCATAVFLSSESANQLSDHDTAGVSAPGIYALCFVLMYGFHVLGLKSRTLNNEDVALTLNFDEHAVRTADAIRSARSFLRGDRRDGTQRSARSRNVTEDIIGIPQNTICALSREVSIITIGPPENASVAVPFLRLQSNNATVYYEPEQRPALTNSSENSPSNYAEESADYYSAVSTQASQDVPVGFTCCKLLNIVLRFLLFVGFSVHSLIEGVGLGSSRDPRTLGIGVTLHKCLAGLAVGTSLADQEVNCFAFVTAATVFSAMTPLGAVVGTVWRLEGGVCLGIFTAAAGGTLLFVALVELIPKAFACHNRDLFRNYVALITGVVLVIAISYVHAE